MGLNLNKRLDHEVGSLRDATFVQFASKYLNVGATLVVSMVLARLLTPEQYGTMSVVSVFLGLFSILSTTGIGAAVIQYRDLTDEDCGSLFVFTLITGVLMAGVLCLLSFPIAWIYDNSAYKVLIPVASLSVVFQAADMVPNGMLVRDKRFLVTGMRLIVTSLVAGAVAVVMALLGFGVWALITQTVLQSFLNTAWDLRASKMRIVSLRFMDQLRVVGSFSGYQFVSQVAQYLMRNLDNLLIGAVMGSTVLGIYDKAYKLAKYPINYIPSVITPVLKSFFSSMKGDLEAIYKMFFKVTKCLFVLGVFISVFCFFAGEELILLLYGDQWVDSIAPFQMLSLSIAFQMVNFTVFSILEGAKRTDYLVRHVLITSSITAVLLLVGLAIGDLTVIAGLIGLSFSLTMIPFIYYVVHKVFAKSIWGFVKAFLPELGAGLVTAVVLAVLDMVLPDVLILSFAVKLVAGVLVYGLIIWRTGQLEYLTSFLRRK